MAVTQIFITVNALRFFVTRAVTLLLGFVIGQRVDVAIRGLYSRRWSCCGNCGSLAGGLLVSTKKIRENLAAGRVLRDALWHLLELVAADYETHEIDM